MFGGIVLKYDSRMGIAYDTIFYGVLYFNFDRLKENYQKYPDISDEDFHLFYQLKEQISAPPPELYPFFYSDVLKPSFISNHFFYHFRFGQEDFAAFLARIETDSSFMQALIEYYLGQLDEAPTLENKKIVQKILQLDLCLLYTSWLPGGPASGCRGPAQCPSGPRSRPFPSSPPN